MQAPALAPNVVRFTVNRAELMFIEHLAQEAGVSVAEYIRVTLGLSRRPMGRPTADTIAETEADARALLGRIGVDPAPYFPAESAPVQSEHDETAVEREARVARLRALTASLRERSYPDYEEA
jgi:hypothetical protein